MVARLPVGKIDRREKAWTRNPGLRFLAPAWVADDGAFHDVSASFDANVVCHPIPSAKLSNHLEHRTSGSVTNDTRVVGAAHAASSHKAHVRNWLFQAPPAI